MALPPRLDPKKILVVLPALNEEESVGLVVKEVFASLPEASVLVIDDASTDRTAAEAREAGAQVVSNVFTLGVGGAMRVGFRVAERQGYDVLVQVDADGQHDPRDIRKLVDALGAPGTPGALGAPGTLDADSVGDAGADPLPRVVIGARFAGQGDFAVPRARRLAMRLLAHRLSRVVGGQLTDVTSGFRAHNRAAIELFARTYPADYLADTVESLVIVGQAGGRVDQLPVVMRARYGGIPSQSSWKAGLYLVRVVSMLAFSVFRRRNTDAQESGEPQ
jgi:glycosyltransferase involved in cell wall biosynthesis